MFSPQRKVFGEGKRVNCKRFFTALKMTMQLGGCMADTIHCVHYGTLRRLRRHLSLRETGTLLSLCDISPDRGISFQGEAEGD